MLSMGMPEGNIYDITILAIIYLVLTCSLNNGIVETTKLGLLYRLDQKLLFLFNLEPYRFPDRKLDNMPVIPEMLEKSSLTISFPQLTLDIRAADNFCIVLVEPLKYQFIASEGLSDIDYICCHVCAVIELDKEFDSSSGPHRLDILSPFALAPEAVDEIACCYSCLSLE